MTNPCEIFAIDWNPPRTVGEWRQQQDKGLPTTAEEVLQTKLTELDNANYEIVSVVSYPIGGRLVVHETQLELYPRFFIVARKK